jgi:hypothetical protein
MLHFALVLKARGWNQITSIMDKFTVGLAMTGRLELSFLYRCTREHSVQRGHLFSYEMLSYVSLLAAVLFGRSFGDGESSA